jgi:hypothetical protein
MRLRRPHRPEGSPELVTISQQPRITLWSPPPRPHATNAAPSRAPGRPVIYLSQTAQAREPQVIRSVTSRSDATRKNRRSGVKSQSVDTPSESHPNGRSVVPVYTLLSPIGTR